MPGPSGLGMCISVIFPSQQPTLVNQLLTVNRHDYFKLKLNYIRKNKVPVAQWLEHCVSSAKVVGSIPREHIY